MSQTSVSSQSTWRSKIKSNGTWYPIYFPAAAGGFPSFLQPKQVVLMDGPC